MKFKNDPRALCIGNFDGVHRGHQALLQKAASLSAHVVVMTFAPHPRFIFKPDTEPFLITAPPHKNRLLRQFGTTEIITWPFSKDLAAVPADIFLKEVIIKQTKPDFVIIGEDFHFGKDRVGNVALLREAADKGKFDLHVVPTESMRTEKISSTVIRQYLAKGEIREANQQLGWRYAIEETVIHGDKRGREIGFPTANQHAGAGCMLPSFGVYASFIEIDGKRYQACTNIGIRPTFAVSQPLVETHIFDFSGDLYGKILHVEPLIKLRNEEKYETLEALIAQITKDCQQARALLSSHA